jgi:replication factor A1
MGNKWRIKCRLAKKNERRSWKNDRGEGYLVNVELIDEDGSRIQGTFFKDMVDKFDDILNENSCYVISGGMVKVSPAKYAVVKNEYCIVFEKSTEIELIDDDGSVAGCVSESPNSF